MTEDDSGQLSVADGKRKAVPVIIDADIIEIDSSDSSSDDEECKMLSTPPTSQSTEVVAKPEPSVPKHRVFDANWMDNDGLTDLDIPVIKSISEFVEQDGIFGSRIQDDTKDIQSFYSEKAVPARTATSKQIDSVCFDPSIFLLPFTFTNVTCRLHSTIAQFT